MSMGKKRETYYYNRNSKECFKYLALFGIWYLVTLLIIIKFLSEVMAPTPELINVFRFFFAVGIIFSAWSGYKYLSKGRTHKTYYKHPDLKRDALKLIKSNTRLISYFICLNLCCYNIGAINNISRYSYLHTCTYFSN